MGTIVGIVIGSVGSLLIARHYFLRSTKKSLGLYRLLSSRVFAGIDPDVKSELNFSFRGHQVAELHQLMFVVANDGERAISNVIQPLTASLPATVEVLDVSILYRYPEGLDATLVYSPPISDEPSESAEKITFSFPLLNSGDFFIAKLLLSGELDDNDIDFRILSEDLPRVLRLKRIPPDVYERQASWLEWPPLIIGLTLLLVPAWIAMCGYLLYQSRPEMFPFPWSTFVLSGWSVAFLVPAVVVAVLFSVVAVGAMLAGLFGGAFPPSPRSPFTLPREVANKFGGGFEMIDGAGEFVLVETMGGQQKVYRHVKGSKVDSTDD